MLDRATRPMDFQFRRVLVRRNRELETAFIRHEKAVTGCQQSKHLRVSRAESYHSPGRFTAAVTADQSDDEWQSLRGSLIGQ